MRTLKLGYTLPSKRTVMVRRSPRSRGDSDTGEILRRISASLDPVAFGASLAVVCGGLLFLGTTFLVVKGGVAVGSHLDLLAQYLPGYSVTAAGSFVGAMYGLASGFLFGWVAAHLRNLFLRVYLWLIRLWANLSNTYFLDRFD